MRCVVQGGDTHTTRGLFSRRSSFNLSVPAFVVRLNPFQLLYCTARPPCNVTAPLSQEYSRLQQNRLDHNESPASKDRSQQTIQLVHLSEFVMSVVWSRQQVVQRTFGPTVSIADSVSQVTNEEATCEFHEQRAGSGTNLSHSCVVCTQVLRFPYAR